MQKTVSAYFTSDQILHFAFAEQDRRGSQQTRHVETMMF